MVIVAGTFNSFLSPAKREPRFTQFFPFYVTNQFK